MHIRGDMMTTKVKWKYLAVGIIVIIANLLFYYCGVFDSTSGEHYILNALFPKNVIANFVFFLAFILTYGLLLYVRGRKSR
jgi:hypothetical protein